MISSVNLKGPYLGLPNSEMDDSGQSENVGKFSTHITLKGLNAISIPLKLAVNIVVRI